MRSIDISTPISEGMAVFPGDPPVRVRRTHSVARGDPYNLSSLEMGSHTGTHVDPPSHFLDGGATADELDLSVLNGPCRVVETSGTSTLVGAREVAEIPEVAERVLWKTSNSSRWARGEAFFADYVSLDVGAAEALLARRVRLVGIDALSIESDPTGKYPVHHRLLGAGTLILEGLRLDGVPAGLYELRCLPLRLQGGDGGPARAVLETL
ncbi:MAG TPA: cyclase family protein [Thermoplasmata archaeon]